MSRLVRDPLAAWAERAPDALAVRSGSLEWTNAELLAAADSLAATLAAEGVAPGQRVAALLTDGVPAVTLIHAARRLGAVLVPLNHRAAAPELASQVGIVSPVLLLHDEDHAALAAACAETAGVRTLDIAALVGDGGSGQPGAMDTEVDLDAPACILFTSGTTGSPRGAILSHANLAASADAWAAVLQPRTGDRWLACLPLFHVAGLAIIVRASRWGASLELLERSEAVDIAAALDRGVTHLSLVPTQLERLLAVRSGTAPGTLRAILLGGGPISAGLLERALAAGYPVFTTYGMTETASGVAVGGADPATIADPTALRPLPGVDLRVAPEDGEILVRGGMVFNGYVGGDAGHPVDADGWLHTGDLGTLDERGLLRLTGRRDDLIISGGENIAPAEVEAVLVGLPGIAEAAVIGRPDATWGAVPIAAIVLEQGAVVDDATLTRLCRDQLAGFKVPAAFHRVSALPRTSSGKVLRDRLRRDLIEDAP